MSERAKKLRVAAELLSASTSTDLRGLGEEIAAEVDERGEGASLLRAAARAFLPVEEIRDVVRVVRAVKKASDDDD